MEVCCLSYLFVPIWFDYKRVDLYERAVFEYVSACIFNKKAGFRAPSTAQFPLIIQFLEKPCIHQTCTLFPLWIFAPNRFLTMHPLCFSTKTLIKNNLPLISSSTLFLIKFLFLRRMSYFRWSIMTENYESRALNPKKKA